MAARRPGLGLARAGLLRCARSIALAVVPLLRGDLTVGLWALWAEQERHLLGRRLARRNMADARLECGDGPARPVTHDAIDEPRPEAELIEPLLKKHGFLAKRGVCARARLCEPGGGGAARNPRTAGSSACRHPARCPLCRLGMAPAASLRSLGAKPADSARMTMQMPLGSPGRPAHALDGNAGPHGEARQAVSDGAR